MFKKNNLTISTPDTNEVTGLSGRHRLQKTKQSPRNARYLRTGSWVDVERKNLQAYEYLCHIGEVKEWIEKIIGEEIAPITSLDEDIRNGIVLAKLVKKFEPDCVKRIFEDKRLQYRHSDNINYVFSALNKIGLPENFKFELTDLYDKKNIPKVIYCLHALSHLLYKRKLAPSINNLIGYLQFTDEQIHITQRQLDNSGVALPQFKNVRSQLAKEMNEPLTKSFVEYDIQQQTDSLKKVQGVMRGYLVRRDWIKREELIEDKVISLQAISRKVLERKKYLHKVNEIKTQVEPKVVTIQALSRGLLSRNNYLHKKQQVSEVAEKITKLQAQAKGVAVRLIYSEKLKVIQSQSASLPELQGLCKGVLTRKKVNLIKSNLTSETVNSSVCSLQALIKSKLVQKEHQLKLKSINEKENTVVSLQALSKAVLARRKDKEIKAELKVETNNIQNVQSIAKGYLTRRKFVKAKEEIIASKEDIINLQAIVRGHLARKEQSHKMDELKMNETKIIDLQAMCKRHLTTKAWTERQEILNNNYEKIELLQGLGRGLLVRNKWTKNLTFLNEQESKICQIQAMARGFIHRNQANARLNHFEQHEDTVIKLQSIFRAKMAKRAYYDIAMKENPPVAAMRNFLYLLDDTDADFTAELELEKLRQKVVQTIRSNKTTESELSELDIKIALLVKNRITLDEVVNSSKGLFQSKRNSFALDGSGSFNSFGSMSSTNVSISGFSLKSLDKESRMKLKNYQSLFYLLQIHPVYLARLLVYNKNQMGDRGKKFIETIVLTLFNFAQNKREEYLLLKLFKQAIDEEINSVNKIEEFLRGNPVFIQLAVHYNRGAKERKYLRDLLQPLIKPILEDKDLDLETDPVCIYRGVIREEESKTGTKSKKKYNVSKQSALNDPETKAAFIKHLQQLRSITSSMIDAILDSLDSMPYGVRYIAKELKKALIAKFPEERPNTIIKVVGHLVYYRYINPAITAPELFDVIETVINPIQRKNLAEIAKMLNQVSMGKLFSDENIFLQPLNNFIGFTAEKFARYFESVTEVDEPEIVFDIDEYLDQVNTRKPTIYISYNEIISLHRLIHENADIIAVDENDPIHKILNELGPAPQLMNFDDRTLGKEIALVLTDPLTSNNQKAEVAQQIFLETKRQVLYVIKVQSGQTLHSILLKEVSKEEEVKYSIILDEEISNNEKINDSPSPSESSSSSIDLLTSDFLANLRRLTLTQLKQHILKNMEDLESYGLVSKEDGYQSIVNAIAKDIKNKHQRRQQRSEEFRKVRQTLVNLSEISSFLLEQKKSYHSYISTCMSNLRAGKAQKKHRTRPFSQQYFHVKGLQRSGKMPKFGSYKYKADELYKRGILESIAKFNPNDFGKMSLTISSDEMGVFHVEAALHGLKIPNAKVELRFDELLQAQFDNVTTLSLFDEQVKVNVNLLLYLINKKFYT
ncbi:hypothetical protein K502DRAFT_367280 [Neoconidiobolus thromboides FSU 785]|nr:hypothetical protein K502DRAFT_367280 [Neoconidiobolus thromboides FSU 785]